MSMPSMCFESRFNFVDPLRLRRPPASGRPPPRGHIAARPHGISIPCSPNPLISSLEAQPGVPLRRFRHLRCPQLFSFFRRFSCVLLAALPQLSTSPIEQQPALSEPCSRRRRQPLAPFPLLFPIRQVLGGGTHA